jgi:hypothetical protein
VTNLCQTEVLSKHGQRKVAGHVIDTAAACMKAYAALIDPIRKVARQFGYAVALHGSLARDIDLVAIPWTEEAVPPELLVEAVAELVKGYEGGSFGSIDADCPRDKPHGRRAWSIHGWAFYIDLSVMPRLGA